ncbi:MAG: adenine deaminase [Bacteroidales bacterium]|nr:adenine deaminase [Bacteroidales bacterium]
MKVFGNIFDIDNREFIRGSVEVEGGRIMRIKQEETDKDVYILPGLVDSHIHIESSMLTPSAFAEEAVRHGTVGVVTDPHEIANVMGVEGVEYMIENCGKVPLKFYFGAPSCVPATPFETSGGTIDAKGVEELLRMDEVRYLSEMMNVPGVLGNNEQTAKKIKSALDKGKPVDGHAPGLRGRDLQKYIDAGISTDHESIDIEEAREKMDKGMKIQIREGSAARSLDSFHYLLGDDCSKLMLCSDDLHPEMLKMGHINLLVKKLIELGYDIFDVIKISVFNPVEHYSLDVGRLKEGDSADFIVIDNPYEFNIKETWIDGKKVYDGQDVSFKARKGKEINRFNSAKISKSDIQVSAYGSKIRLIKASDGELITDHLIKDAVINNGNVVSGTGQDILKIVVKDRYNDGDPAIAFISGYGLQKGAFASSVAHDSHNIIALGVDDESICKAINSVVEMKGGLSVYDGNELNSLQLEIGGIMTNVPCGTVAAKYEELSRRVKELGCSFRAPFMTLSFMALPVIPDLKLTDKGLFDVNKFDFVDLFVGAE